MMSNMISLVAVFESHEKGENAIRELQKYDFDMQLSIIGKDYHTEDPSSYYNSVTGPLVTVSGLLVDCIVNALEGAVMVGGPSALGAGLLSIGIPKNRVVQYETEVKNGKCLLILHGSVEEVERARDLLAKIQATTSRVYPERSKVRAKHEAMQVLS
jgi:hypothetical protein